MAGALAKALKGMGSTEPDGDESSADAAPSDDEMAAFSELKAALKSDDDELGATAMKNFMKACGY